MLSAVDFANPLLWAVLIAWIISVVLHEFAHGIVAYFGGDYTIRERGGLTLNPLQYVDPFLSIVMPVVFLLMGGVPLPGGVTYVRRDLLRNRAWESSVSAAGPAANLLLCAVCVAPLHPAVGWLDPLQPASWTTFQTFLGAMAFLQFIAVILNVIPVPPLDGFNMLSPFMSAPMREKLLTPPLAHVLFFGYFFVLWTVPGVFQGMYRLFAAGLGRLGFDEFAVDFFRVSFMTALWGSA